MLQHCVVLRLVAGVDETMGEAGFLMCSLSIQGEGGSEEGWGSGNRAMKTDKNNYDDSNDVHVLL